MNRNLCIIRLAQLPIRLYRFFISPILGPRCRHCPTCSAYALEAMEKHGIFKGILLAASRILRCHPWGGDRWVDPVPERFAWSHLIRYKRGHAIDRQQEPDRPCR